MIPEIHINHAENVYFICYGCECEVEMDDCFWAVPETGEMSVVNGESYCEECFNDLPVFEEDFWGEGE